MIKMCSVRARMHALAGTSGGRRVLNQIARKKMPIVAVVAAVAVWGVVIMVFFFFASPRKRGVWRMPEPLYRQKKLRSIPEKDPV